MFFFPEDLGAAVVADVCCRCCWGKSLPCFSLPRWKARKLKVYRVYKPWKQSNGSIIKNAVRSTVNLQNRKWCCKIKWKLFCIPDLWSNCVISPVKLRAVWQVEAFQELQFLHCEPEWEKKTSWFPVVAWSTMNTNFLSWLSLPCRFHSSHSCFHYSWEDTATFNLDVYLLLIVATLWLHWNYYLYDSLYLLHLDTTVASESCWPPPNLSCSGFQVYSLKGFFFVFSERWYAFALRLGWDVFV